MSQQWVKFVEFHFHALHASQGIGVHSFESRPVIAEIPGISLSCSAVIGEHLFESLPGHTKW
jgi:hypothetical protein